MGRCKITVLKTLALPELVNEYQPGGHLVCDQLTEGQVFYTSGPFGVDMPEGFCKPAWAAIQTYAAVLACGGKVYGVDEVHLTACPDGLRPVIFRMEAAEE